MCWVASPIHTITQLSQGSSVALPVPCTAQFFRLWAAPRVQEPMCCAEIMPPPTRSSTAASVAAMSPGSSLWLSQASCSVKTRGGRPSTCTTGLRASQPPAWASGSEQIAAAPARVVWQPPARIRHKTHRL